MQDQTNAIWQGVSCSLCSSFNKRLAHCCADMICWQDVQQPHIKQPCCGIQVTCGNTLSSQRLNKDLIAKLKWGWLLLSDGGRSFIFYSVMEWWKRRQNLAAELEHARDDTDTLDDTDGPLIACGSPYSPCANSTAAREAAPEESDVSFHGCFRGYNSFQ